METKFETAVIGGGCFWCTEAVFKMLRGVESVKPGYAGGETENPTYESVSAGNTGHAEAIEIVFDPAQVHYADLLTIFFASHDPTTLNRQGHDVGTQYRSIILTTTLQQDVDARKFIENLNESNEMGASIVTEIKPLIKFYEAENYHKNYYENNKDSNMYCELVINPKLEKVQKQFADLLKKQNV